MSITRQIINFINNELDLDIDRDEVREFESAIGSNDFWVEIDGGEYRVIHSEEIWDIYVDEIKMITQDCYDIKSPSWLAIDWEETAQNCFVDGYGHTFATYDGVEYEFTFGEEDYYIFKTN